MLTSSVPSEALGSGIGRRKTPRFLYVKCSSVPEYYVERSKIASEVGRRFVYAMIAGSALIVDPLGVLDSAGRLSWFMISIIVALGTLTLAIDFIQYWIGARQWREINREMLIGRLKSRVISKKASRRTGIEAGTLCVALPWSINERLERLWMLKVVLIFVMFFAAVVLLLIAGTRAL